MLVVSDCAKGFREQQVFCLLLSRGSWVPGVSESSRYFGLLLSRGSRVPGDEGLFCGRTLRIERAVKALQFTLEGNLVRTGASSVGETFIKLELCKTLVGEWSRQNSN